nr:DUF3592 domain-containing protein [Bacteriovorax sp. HI3]
MLVLIIVAAVFFYFALGALFIHRAYSKFGKVYPGKVIGLHRKQNSVQAHQDNFPGFYYCPVIEYTFSTKEKVIFIGGGNAEIEHTIGQKVDVLVLNGRKENVILRDKTYLIFGLVFLFIAIVDFAIYIKFTSFMFGLYSAVFFFGVLPSALYFFLRFKSQSSLTDLLNNSNLVTMDQLKTMNVIWQTSETAAIKERSFKIGMMVCQVFMFLCLAGFFMTWKSLSPEGAFSAKLFLTGKIAWNDLANSTQRALVILGCILYAAAMLVFSMVRLNRKRKNAQITSINS